MTSPALFDGTGTTPRKSLAAALTCRHYTPESNAESAALPDRDRQEIVPYRGQTAV